MKVSLVYPPNSKIESEMPIGLLSVASKLKAEGHDVTVIDIAPLVQKGLIENNRNIYSNIADYLLEHCPADIYGFSTVATLEIPSLHISKIIKAKRKDAYIVFGNQWASMNDTVILEYFDYVDCIVRGEGEISFAEYVNCLESDNDIRKVPGISYRSNGEIFRNPDRPLIEDLNTLPPLNYSLLYFGLDEYARMDREYVGLVEGGRGCSFNCNYCSTSAFWRRRARIYSNERIIDEIKHLMSHGFDYLFFTYDNFGTFRKYSCDLFRKLAAEFHGDLDWFARCRVDCMDPETLKLMADAGCKNILVGAESGSNDILKKMNKGITVKQTIAGMKNILQLGITPKVSFLTGLPYENKDTVFKTMTFACELSFMNDFLDSKIHFFAPLAGTEITQSAIRENRLIFSESSLISPDMSQFLEWGGDCMGASDHYVRLDDDQRLIDEYPALFSSYGYVRNDSVDAQYFSSLSNYFNMLIERYPITTLFLLHVLHAQDEDFIASFESFCENCNYDKKNLWSTRVFVDDRDGDLVGNLYSFFKKFAMQYQPKHPALGEIFKYEDMIMNTFLKLGKSKEPADTNITDNILPDHITVNGVISRYEYDILSLIERAIRTACVQGTYKWSEWLSKKDLCLISTMESKGDNASLSIYEISSERYELLRVLENNRSVEDAINEYSTKFNVDAQQTENMVTDFFREMPQLFDINQSDYA